MQAKKATGKTMEADIEIGKHAYQHELYQLVSDVISGYAGRAIFRITWILLGSSRNVSEVAEFQASWILAEVCRAFQSQPRVSTGPFPAASPGSIRHILAGQKTIQIRSSALPSVSSSWGEKAA